MSMTVVKGLQSEIFVPITPKSVFTPVTKPLNEMTVALATAAGVHVKTDPIDRLHELREEGFIKACAPTHAGFMGGGGNIEKFTNETGPEIAQMLKDEGADAAILTAG